MVGCWAGHSVMTTAVNWADLMVLHWVAKMGAHLAVQKVSTKVELWVVETVDAKAGTTAAQMAVNWVAQLVHYSVVVKVLKMVAHLAVCLAGCWAEH